MTEDGTGGFGQPPLTRDKFRDQRTPALAAAPVVVTPAYGDEPLRPVASSSAAASAVTNVPTSARSPRPKPSAPRNPFDAYGERSSSRPYALRLPDAIDLVLRQMAAEERTHPLRVIDRILHDHLKKAGRLPPVG